MQQVDIENSFVEFVVGRAHRSGRVSLPIRLAAEAGISHWVRITRIRSAKRHGLLREVGGYMYVAAVDMPEHEWQSHLDDLQLSPHQREILLLRLRLSFAELPEVPPVVAERIIEATSVEGEFPLAVVGKFTFSSGQRRSTTQHLIDSGVVTRKNKRTLVFASLPPRNPTESQRGKWASPTVRRDVDYGAVVRMIARGDDFGAVAYETGVPATVCDKMAKALRMDEMVRQLVNTGKRSQLPKLLGVPSGAAEAIAEHVNRDSPSDIRSTAR